MNWSLVFKSLLGGFFFSWALLGGLGGFWASSLSIARDPTVDPIRSKPHPFSSIFQIEAGGSQTCVLLRNHMVKCLGNNDHGQLGLGDKQTRGSQLDQLMHALPALNIAPPPRYVISLALGPKHSCAILDDHSSKCWGRNTFGELGQEDATDRGWTTNQMGDHLAPIDFGDLGKVNPSLGRFINWMSLFSTRKKIFWDSIEDSWVSTPQVKSIVLGAFHTCALFFGGQVKCMGFNYHGQLGLGDNIPRGDLPAQMGNALPFVDLGTKRTALALVAGAWHTCALLDNQLVKCWGYNHDGELGLEHNQVRGTLLHQMGDHLATVNLGTDELVKSIAAGAFHTCAILVSGETKCWGYNKFGALGLGDTMSRGDRPGTMGNALPAVDLGSKRKALQISAADYGTCALLDNHATKCWGLNSEGELGLGDRNDRGVKPQQMGDLLPELNLSKDLSISSIASGSEHHCVQYDNRTAQCWGANESGQLGHGDSLPKGVQANQMGNQLPFLNL